MKKIFAIVALALGLSVAAAAQPKAIGGRFGYDGVEVDYQHYLGNPNFLQVNAGLAGYSDPGFQASVLYNYTFAQPNWTSRGDWAWYAGAGLSAGYVWDRGNRTTNDVAGVKTTYYERAGMGAMVSIPVQVGLSFTFWFPLQLSVDIRPYFGIQNVTNKETVGGVTTKTSTTGFYNWGLYGFCPTISAHYAF